MAIRPVEVQGVVQRSQDIGQIKQNQDQKPFVEQNHIQLHIQKETERNSQQVTKFQDADKKENRYDAKEKGNGHYFGQRRGKRSEQVQDDDDGDSVTVKSIDHGSFDVKI